MNERYTFRGRRVDNDEWIQGGYAYTAGKHIIFAEHEAKEVDPATIGQCTGLRDSKRTGEYPKGQLIFEGNRVLVEGYRAPIYEEARSQFDGKVIAEAVVEFSCFGWRLNGNTGENKRLCELKGSETTEREIRIHRDLNFYNPPEEMRSINPRRTNWNIIVAGNIHDNPELMEETP
jgi:hypothetical protein